MNENMKFPTLEAIKTAHQRIQPYIHRTPLMKSEAINAMAGCEIFFKCENFQKVGAFKARGAANAVAKLSDAQKKNGVATHSSGNHAAALARAAAVADIKSYIVMPSNAPEIKKKAVKGYGGEIIECEPNLLARETTLQAVVEKTGATFIPPYDYMDVVEGQATCALEMWEEGIPFDTIMAPVGGGGLLGGTALTTKYLSPSTQVIAGEPEGADDAYRSFQAKKLIPMEGPKTIADGLLTSLGEINFAIIMEYVDDILTVSDAEIVAAMRLVYERMKIVIEPSCAVPLAALLKHKERFKGQKVGVILSGGNVDLGKLPF
jgi:threonine dehydratase